MKKTLIIGYGNKDREDDGAGWHMLSLIAEAYNLAAPTLPGDSVINPDGDLELLYLFQLLPELAEDLANYKLLIFLDAHNSNQLPEVIFEPVVAKHEHSAFTHHLAPEELLAITQTIGIPLPETWIASVRGHSFSFASELTAQTASSVDLAVRQVLALLLLD